MRTVYGAEITAGNMHYLTIDRRCTVPRAAAVIHIQFKRQVAGTMNHEERKENYARE